MRFKNGALELTIVILLSFAHLALATPLTSTHALKVRSVAPMLPEPKEDALPKGDAKDLISWTDDDVDNEDFKNTPDYDPDQDKDFDEEERSFQVAVDKGTTKWLRSVGVDGQ